MWVRIDDQFFDHPKARAAGRDGRDLYLAALCWTAGNLTDGFVAATDLPLVAAKAEVARAGRAAGLLVAVDLWEAVPGGWRIHDYHDWNPSAADEKSKRAKRAEAGRKGGRISRPPRQPNPEPSPNRNGTKTEANREAGEGVS